MHRMEFFEKMRRFKRFLDGYISTRRAFLLLLVFFGILLYIGPSLFRWIQQRTPIMIDPNIGCVAQLVDPFLKDSNDYNANVRRTYESSDKSYLPYVGNGRIGLPIEENAQLYIFSQSSFALSLPFYPLVEVSLPDSSSSQAASVTDYTSGIVHRFRCFSKRRKSIHISHQFYAHRQMPFLLVQQIELANPLGEEVTLLLKQNIGNQEMLHVQNIRLQNTDEEDYIILSGKKKADKSSHQNIIAFVIATTKVPESFTLIPRSSSTLKMKSVVVYSKPISEEDYPKVKSKLEAECRENLKKALNINDDVLRKNHIEVWKQLWTSGFSISESKAQNALNGDKINATMYYVLSHLRSFIHEEGISPAEQTALLYKLSYPDMCYQGHSTLQASTLWSDLSTVSAVNKVVSLWLLTLRNMDCQSLIQAGAEGIMQAMILSFGSLRFNNYHLEFTSDPSHLHRDYLFRRISYGNATHLNITVTVGEDNKAVLGVALDRSDKDYYACDGGCLDPPIKLSYKPVVFPVKLTRPVTAILYITSDKPHMERLKHSIHVTEVVEAPAHEHHVIALHRHGHQLGGLPAIFWVSIAFLIVVFHLFLAKLIYNEYCGGNPEKIRGRYVV